VKTIVTEAGRSEAVGVSAAGLTFRETTAGAFALGESVPERGRAVGRTRSTRLSLHATVSIPDVRAFVADPHHRGRLSGRVVFPPLGAPAESTGGRLSLFVPTAEPGRMAMMYGLGFEQGGRSYWLAGRKNIRNARALDAWADTTTLFTLLHEGGDESGPVIGAGVLTLRVGGLLRMLTTFRATNVASRGEMFGAYLRFGRFFLGELWDGYVANGARRRAR
jgi:hypothetical protein